MEELTDKEMLDEAVWLLAGSLETIDIYYKSEEYRKRYDKFWKLYNNDPEEITNE